MDLKLLDDITKYRFERKFSEAVDLALGVLKSYQLNEASETLDHFPDYLRERLLLIYYELSILLCYTKDSKLKMLKICDKLLYTRKTKLPKDNISENRRFALPLLSSFIDVKNIPVVFTPPDIPGTDKKFRTLNPSILTFEDNYYINIRCVNFNNDRCINFTAIDQSYNNKIVTRNFLLKLDSNMNIIFTKELINCSQLEMKKDLVQGLEDLHLFSYKSQIYFVCSTYYTSVNGVDMCKGAIDFKNEGENDILLDDIKILNYQNKLSCEKNWLPFVKGDKINYLYSQEPLRILSESVDNDFLETNLLKYNTIDCSKHRGSGGPLLFNKGYLIIIHEVVWNGNGRTYMHKFILYDADFNIKKVSLPFKFENTNVDYCRSMTYSLDKKNVFLGVGLEDSEFRIYSIQTSDIEKLLFAPYPYISDNKFTTISIYNASHVTREIETTIFNYIYRLFGKKYIVIKDKNIDYENQNILYIIICPAGLRSLRKPINYITYQLEPSIYKTNLHDPNYLDFLKTSLVVWDYNEINVVYLIEKGIVNAKYFPIGYDYSLSDPKINSYNESDKTIDILFLGWVTPNSRRLKMQYILQEKGFNILFIWDKSPEEMRYLIHRSKICLNIHSYDKGFLETPRISNYLSNYACVVSEVCEDINVMKLYSEGYVQFSTYDDIPNLLMKLLKDKEKRKELADKSFEWYSKERQIDTIITSDIFYDIL